MYSYLCMFTKTSCLVKAKTSLMVHNTAHMATEGWMLRNLHLFFVGDVWYYWEILWNKVQMHICLYAHGVPHQWHHYQYSSYFFSPQRCTESWHHFPWAPEADPGCHPDPQSPGHPNARPRCAGLTGEREWERESERGRERARGRASEREILFCEQCARHIWGIAEGSPDCLVTSVCISISPPPWLWISRPEADLWAGGDGCSYWTFWMDFPLTAALSH